MNPYETEEKEVRKKSEAWRGKNKDADPIMDPYKWEILRLSSERRAWDKMNRKEKYLKETNNPWIQEIPVKVRDDGLSLVLCPRVKLEYDYVIRFYYPHAWTDLDRFSGAIRARFMEYTPPVYIDVGDIVNQRSFTHGSIHNYDDDGGTLVSKVSIFIRDLSFIGDNCPNSDLFTKINLAYKSLSQHSSTFFFRLNSDHFQLKAKPISSQHPHFLLSQFSEAYPEYIATPVIILNNLVSKWFVQPDSSEPSKELLSNFLCAFGEIRYLDVSKNKSKHKLKGELFSALVQYEDYDDFLKALQTLCCCSLRQGDSGELVDYEVTLGREPDHLILAKQGGGDILGKLLKV